MSQMTLRASVYSPFLALYHTKQQSDLPDPPPFRELHPLPHGRRPTPPMEYPSPYPDDIPDLEVPMPSDKPTGQVGGSNSGIEEQAQEGREEVEPEEEQGLAIPSAI